MTDLQVSRMMVSAGMVDNHQEDLLTSIKNTIEIIQTVLLAKENIVNKVTAWQTTPDNTHYPSEKLVKDSLDSTNTTVEEVRTIAQGKTSSYVSNVTRIPLLDVETASVTLTYAQAVDLNGTPIWSTTKAPVVGENLYLTDTTVPDRWVSAFNTSNQTVTLSTLEVSKVDLSKVVQSTVSDHTISNIWKGTQELYDKITTKDQNTFYIIVG